MDLTTKTQFIISSSAGLVAAFVAIVFQGVYRYIIAWKRYSWVRGDYLGYGYKEGTQELAEKPQSRATIKKGIRHILRKYNFLIILEHGDTFQWRWEGILTLYPDTYNYGSIVWKYVKGPGGLLFGFKRCVLDDEKRWVYLVGEGTYGIEVLKPKHDKNGNKAD